MYSVDSNKTLEKIVLSMLFLVLIAFIFSIYSLFRISYLKNQIKKCQHVEIIKKLTIIK